MLYKVSPCMIILTLSVIYFYSHIQHFCKSISKGFLWLLNLNIMLKFPISENPRRKIYYHRPNFKNIHILFKTGLSFFLVSTLNMTRPFPCMFVPSHWFHYLEFSELQIFNLRYRSNDPKNLEKTVSRKKK